ncbi:cadherin domain-containing protein [Altericroceibacterium indicum]|nr:cadherin domain-containing protein [Altericroceibacterium indicum]
MADAHAQTGGEAVAIGDIQGAETSNVLADGSLQITMSNGFTINIPPSQFYIANGEIYISQGAMALNGLVAGATTGLPFGTVVLGVGAVGAGVAAAVAASSDKDSKSGSDGDGNGGDGKGDGDGGNTANRSPVLAGESIVTVDENQLKAYQISATDADKDTLTYSISGTDAALFNVNASTGEVTFKEKPDYEAPNDGNEDGIYIVKVTASDGTKSASKSVSIVVKNANDAPEFTSSDAVSVEENQTLAYQAVTEDREDDNITYSLSGTDASKFLINQTTGEVTFKTAPDYESDPGKTYQITVSADDGTHTTTQDVTITVTDVDEAPVISTAASVDAAEEQTSVVTISAEDPEGKDLTYSITGGADSGKFTIDSATGELNFQSAPDYETPGAADGSNAYQVTITVSDGVEDSTLDLTVNVTNVADPSNMPSTPANADDFTEDSIALTSLVDAGAVDLNIFEDDPDTIAALAASVPTGEWAEDHSQTDPGMMLVADDVLELSLQQMAESDHSDMLAA